jgi:uncharacterized repeat protein (TIGR01451 family)
VRHVIPFALILFSTGCTGDGLFRRDTVARGQGFGPFSSKAARLDVTPQNAAHPTKKDILFVATVYDADGSTLRRREVEWMIEGPGEFVAVDDGGWFTSRGKKSGSKYASTTTHTFEEKLAKKTYSSSAEEPLIKAGQTWVIVSSAVEGKTIITANCPDISDRDKGRVIANVLWANAEYGFPSQAVVPAGGEHQLNTDLARVASAAGANGYRVRYRIVGGAAATLVPSVPGGTGVTSLTGGNPQDVTTNANADGTAGVKIVQAVPASGRTTVVVEVIKPDPNGIGPGTIVARNETAVEWAAPQLSLDLRGPATVGEGRDVPYTLTVANGGKAESPQVTLRATLPNTVSFVSSDPPQSGPQGRDVTWVLPPVPAGEKRDVKLTVRPVRKGSFDLSAVAQTPDGMRAEQKLTSTADAASIRVNVDAPAYAPVGEYVPVRVVVTNTGAVLAENATAWVTGGEGLTAERRDPGEPAEVPVGTVEPGKSKTGTILMKADRAGKYMVKANVTADGGLKEKAESPLEARTAQIKLDLAGPDRVGVGEPATYTLKLKNAGDMALSAVAVKAELPRGLNATDADGGRISNAGGVAMWTVPALNPGETKMLKLATIGDKVGPAATIFATATAGLSGAKGLEVKAEAPVTVAGLPALELELADPAGPIPVGGKATYRITVRNRGTGPARDVQITVEVPGEMTAVKGRTNDSRTASIDDARIIFPAIASLPSGAAVTVFAETEAVRPGSARVRATVTGPDLPQPVREEQATRVSGGSK